VPLPDGWTASTQGSERYLRDNKRSGRLLIVDQTSDPKGDPVADWRTQEQARRGSYRDYHKIRIEAADYWERAADWEFTYTSSNGNPLHVVKRGFVTSEDQAYGIHWSTSVDDWQANLGALKVILDGFRPAPR
jgi:hypothetical protein